MVTVNYDVQTMTGNRQLPDRPSARSVEQFLQQSNQLPQRVSSEPQQLARLIFALDATASRQASWDRACQLQAGMFLSTARLPRSLAIQLCYYRGFNEFYSTGWCRDSQALLKAMSGVQCRGGHTQIARVLRHARDCHRERPVAGLIFIGDAMEENPDQLCQLAGELGLQEVPLFLFQEGTDPAVKSCFQQMATLSKGAYAPFDEHSAAYLSELLGAVACYASGGAQSLRSLDSAAARHLLQQLGH